MVAPSPSRTDGLLHRQLNIALTSFSCSGINLGKEGLIYMNKCHWRKFPQLLLIMMIVIAIGMLALGWSTRTLAEEKKQFLADRHQTKGQTCASCHKESPPKSNVASAICLQCHGDAEKLAIKTREVRPNPHDSHLGEMACDKCHHGHKASEDACGQCHNFGFKTP